MIPAIITLGIFTLLNALVIGLLNANLHDLVYDDSEPLTV